MARIVRKRKPDPPPTTPLAAAMEKHLEVLRAQNYSPYTVKNRRVHLGYFVQWCARSRHYGAHGGHAAHPGALSASSVRVPEEKRGGRSVSAASMRA